MPIVDEIIMIDDGKIVEIGTYEKLKMNNGAFSQFINSSDLNKDEPEKSI